MTDLPMAKLEAMVQEVGLADLPALGAAILAGGVQGRVVVVIDVGFPGRDDARRKDRCPATDPAQGGLGTPHGDRFTLIYWPALPAQGAGHLGLGAMTYLPENRSSLRALSGLQRVSVKTPASAGHCS